MRRWMVLIGAVALIAAGCSLPSTTPGTAGFPNGVAAGDVTATSAILWTRTSADAAVDVDVFDNAAVPGHPVLIPGATVFSGSGSTSAATDHTVKIPVTGLQSNHIYFYRFTNGAESSQLGRFVTAPAANEAASFRFVVAADADGFPVGAPPGFNNFEVLNAARSEQPAFFSFLGDTIYSDSSFRAGGPATTLDDYRDAHEQNRSFANLRNLMSATGTYAQIDDHEVLNDFDGETVNTLHPGRYAAGLQAFHDWMPTDTSNSLVDPSCAGNPRYFHQKWGTQAEIFQLDERSCRSDQNPVKTACTPTSGTFAGVLDVAPTAPASLRAVAGSLLPPSPPAGCIAAIDDPSRTLLGPVQLAQFKTDLANSTAKWKIVLSEDAIQQFYALPYDRWEGYGAERTELLHFIRDNASNVVFLTTDLHANIYNDVFVDKTSDPDPVAYEAISGPIATNTYRNEIINAGLGAAYPILQGVLTVQGVDCQSLDVYSYQVVDVSAAGTMTISSKDRNGNVVGNDTNSAVKCKKVLGP